MSHEHSEYLINEDDGWRMLSSQTEQLAHKLLTLSHPLGNKVTGGHSEKGGLRLCCDCLQASCHQLQAQENLQPTGCRPHPCSTYHRRTPTACYT